MLKKLKAPATFGQFNICTLFCPKIKVFHNVYANYIFLCCHNKETNEQGGFVLRWDSFIEMPPALVQRF